MQKRRAADLASADSEPLDDPRLLPCADLPEFDAGPETLHEILHQIPEIHTAFRGEREEHFAPVEEALHVDHLHRKLPFRDPFDTELHRLPLQLLVVFPGPEILLRRHAQDILQIGGQLFQRGGPDLRHRRSDRRAVVRDHHDGIAFSQREVRRMEGVNLPFLFEFDADDVFQTVSPRRITFLS